MFRPGGRGWFGMSEVEIAEKTATKSAFAEIIQVSAGRVSQMISEGKIPPSCLVGEGRRARIKVEAAKAAIEQSTDIGQRLGNGSKTNLSGATTAPPNSLLDQLQTEKLIKARAENRVLEERERERQGVYVRTADARAECVKALSQMLAIFEGALPDLANALAAKCDLPQRDILHTLRGGFRDVRARASEAVAAKAAGMDHYTEDPVDGLDADSVN